ncbi:GWxTD domain-containing protein [candidate division KSB1 bacterium]|nr:GWxTD domain-containing protein [candidate division KSB1 bacterium]
MLFFALLIGMGSAADNVSPYPLFHYDIVAHAAMESLSSGRIDIFIEVVYDDVQFRKNDDTYQASYELSAIILDGRDQVDGDLWKESLSVDAYEKTNSRRDIDLSHKVFRLDPGKYTVKLGFEDLESGQMYESEEKIVIDDYSKPPISGSEITFARKIEMENGRVKSIFPEVTTNYKGLGYPAFAYFEIYNPQRADEASVSVQISGENTGYKKTTSEIIDLDGERTDYVIALPTDTLSHDRYLLRVEIIVNNKKANLEKIFYIRWGGLPRSADDLDVAINQLHYIASSKEWKKMRKAPDAKKLEYFIEFWKKRDPTPGTEQNEAMESYYAKISTANQEFTVMGRKGWQTDRGIVYIILGPPNEIIRNDYPSGSRPYQIWQYYAINRQFAFFDRNGFGDYEFVNPISIGELQRFAEQL